MISLISIISAIAITYFTIQKGKADNKQKVIVNLQLKAQAEAARYAEESRKKSDSLNVKQQELIVQQQAVIKLMEQNQQKSEEINKQQQLLKI